MVVYIITFNGTLYFFSCFLNWLERERERDINLSFHFFMHSLLDSCIRPDGGLNPPPWRIRMTAKQLSYQARVSLVFFITFFSYFVLFIFREKEGKGKQLSLREGEKQRLPEIHWSLIGYLSHTPNWGPGPQPRHVPWLGIELATLWFTGWRSIHWATPAREVFFMTFVIAAYSLFWSAKSNTWASLETVCWLLFFSYVLTIVTCFLACFLISCWIWTF